MLMYDVNRERYNRGFVLLVKSVRRQLQTINDTSLQQQTPSLADCISFAAKQWR